MKLATLKQDGRDGALAVVDRSLKRCRLVPEIAKTLQAALDHWTACEPALRKVYDELNDEQGLWQAFDQTACHSPLPRAYQWADGSAYINHVELVRKARNAEIPASYYSEPLMYQGCSDNFIGPYDDMVGNESWGIDFEGEIAVITGDITRGASSSDCAKSIRLLMLANDVSLRDLIPAELAKGFGFMQSKPSSAFSPVAVTPDELGEAWRDNKVHLPLVVHLNGELFGHPNAGLDMTFDFGQLIAHVAKTRDIAAGSIIGSGTVSNKQGDLWGSSIGNGGVGYCCLAEIRTYETIERGKPETSFMRNGDVVQIEMFDELGLSIFGMIRNQVRSLRNQT